MFIFPQPKKIICTGELKNPALQFNVLRNDFGVDIEYALTKLKLCDNGMPISIIKCTDYKKEQYTLILDNSGVCITASSQRGAFDALATLRQMIRQPDLRCTIIEDEPDFENRGFLFSIGRLLKMSEFKKFIDFLADLKFNQLQFTAERTAFETMELHDDSGQILSLDDMQELNEYCKMNMIELIPEVNSFGHMHDWLALDKYKDIAVCPQGFYRTDEYNRTSLCKPGTLDPNNPQALELVDRIYSWLLQAFTSTNLNVGCDETFDLGEGKCKELAKTIGKNKIYTDYMNKLAGICKKHNKKMMFWADMIVDDYEALKRMPNDSTALIWGYEEDHPFEEQCRNVKESGLDFYVCPGTSAWGSIVGRSTNMQRNQFSAAKNGKDFGAEGYLLTDWGDCGYIHTRTVTYLPIVYGAGISWGVDNNSDIHNAFDYLDMHLFREKGFSEFLYNCGEAYQLEAYKRFNHAVVVTPLYTNLDDNVYMYDQKIENFEKIVKFANDRLVELDNYKRCPTEYVEEIKLNLKMLIVISKV